VPGRVAGITRALFSIVKALERVNCDTLESRILRTLQPHDRQKYSQKVLDELPQRQMQKFVTYSVQKSGSNRCCVVKTVLGNSLPENERGEEQTEREEGEENRFRSAMAMEKESWIARFPSLPKREYCFEKSHTCGGVESGSARGSSAANWLTSTSFGDIFCAMQPKQYFFASWRSSTDNLAGRAESWQLPSDFLRCAEWLLQLHNGRDSKKRKNSGVIGTLGIRIEISARYQLDPREEKSHLHFQP